MQELADIHTKFLEKLREAVQPNSKLKLSQVFFDFREPFLIYGEYCSNMTNATDALRDQTAKNESMRQMVNQCQKEHSEGRVQLRDILSVPMQRILKYHLLLKKLVDETSPVSVYFYYFLTLARGRVGIVYTKEAILFFFCGGADS